MTIPLSWKVIGAATCLIGAGLAWNGVSQYLEARRADEIIQESARAAAVEARLAQAQARQRHEQLATSLRQRREELASNYRQIATQGRDYQARRAVQLGRQLEQARRIEESYMLGENQQCANGIVINRRGSTYTQARGKGGEPIECQGNKASQPLR